MSRLQNQDLKDAVQGSMDSNQGVQLPFVAPSMWWKNGEAALKPTQEIKDARRFGGWGISEEDVANNSLELPNTFSLFEMNGNNGNYNAYLARFVYVAPICRRFVWFQKPDGNWTSKLNVLVYMAEMKPEKELVQWGPVVISAKGFSGKYIDDAFGKFSAKTASMRDGDPVNYFYHPLGTFTSEPIFEKITGKGGASSPITPCQLFMPKEGYSDSDMDKYFVSEEVAAVMADLLEQAKEWQADWNKKGEKREVVLGDEQTHSSDEEFPF